MLCPALFALFATNSLFGTIGTSDGDSLNIRQRVQAEGWRAAGSDPEPT
jgi:hypothetical protein